MRAGIAPGIGSLVLLGGMRPAARGPALAGPGAWSVPTAPSVDRCQALWATAFICVLQGDHDDAVERADEAVGSGPDSSTIARSRSGGTARARARCVVQR